MTEALRVLEEQKPDVKRSKIVQKLRTLSALSPPINTVTVVPACY